MDEVVGMLGGAPPQPSIPVSKRHDNANAIPFAWLCERFEMIENESSRDAKLNLLFCPELSKKLGGQSIYPLLRLVLPDSDNLRHKYGVKYTALGKLYVTALKISPQSEHGRNILEWKLNKGAALPLDIADCIYNALKGRVSGTQQLNIQQVNALLDQLAATRYVPFRMAETAEDKENRVMAGTKATIIKEQIIHRIPAQQQKWIIRLILATGLDSLKIGLNLRPVLGKLNAFAVLKMNERNDLRRACEDDDSTSHLEVGVACFPMLAKYFPAAKCTKLGMVGTVENAMRGPGGVMQPFVMDKKIDGERLIIHLEGRHQAGGSLAYAFTRKVHDSSNFYRPILDEIHSRISPIVDNVILDGEIVLWNKNTGEYIVFGSNAPMAKVEILEMNNPGVRFRKSSDFAGTQIENYQDLESLGLKYIVFDILFLQGNEGVDKLLHDCAASVEQLYGIGHPLSVTQGQITHFPLAMRRLILRQLFTPIEHRFEFIEHEIVSNGDRKLRCELLGAYFDRTVSKNEEGLVIKNLASPYVLGEPSRGKNAGWVKLKPEYNDQTQPLDLLICGAYWGEGKLDRKNKVFSTFLLCCKANPKLGETDEMFCQNPRFVPIGKVGGFSQEIKLKLTRLFAPSQIPLRQVGVRSSKVVYPSWLVGLPNAPILLKADDVPDFLILPHKSIVIQVKCSSIVDTDDFPTGFTLRFPRLDELREDKKFSEVEDVATLAEYKKQGSLTAAEAENMQYKRGRGGAGGSGSGGGGGGGSATKVQVLSKVPEHFKVNSAVVKQKTKIFAGLKFWLSDTFLPGSQQYGLDLSKVGVDVLVRENGGTIMASADPTTIVLVGTGKPENLQLKNIKKAGTHDILSVGFVVDSVRMQRLVDKKPSHYLCQTDATRQAMRAAGFDALGDHVADDTSVTELQSLLACIDLKNMHSVLGPALAAPINGSSSSSSSGGGGGGGGSAKKLKIERRSEEQETALRASDRERARILKEASRLSTQGWRDIAAAMTLEERAVVEGSHNAFWNPGNVIYLDLYSSLGPMEKAAGSAPRPAGDLLKHPSPALVALRHRLPLRGAVLAPSLHVGVTHVIVDPLDTGRFQALRERRRLLRLEPGCLFEKRFVTAAWAESIIGSGQFSPPTQSELADVDGD